MPSSNNKIPGGIHQNAIKAGKGHDGGAEEETLFYGKAKEAARPFIVPIVWFSIILVWILVFALILAAASPVFIWGWHILGPEDMRWLDTIEVDFLQTILLEFKEVLLGSAVTASIMAFTMRSKK